MLNRAHSIVTIKSVDDDKRIIRGMATTPAVDSYGDIIEPMGVKAAKDIPLFLYHDSMQTVGRAKLDAPTKAGVPFEASIPHVKELGRLKDRVDEAWQMLKYRLITGVSIGFQPVADKIERMKNGGMRFLETNVLELSLVPVPANSEATITAIRSADAALRAPLGLEQRAKPPDRRTSPVGEAKQPAAGGFSFSRSKGTNVKTLQEMTEARETKSARMRELVEERQKAADGKFTTDQATEFDTIEAELDELEEEMRMARFNERMAAGATRVRGDDPGTQRASRGPSVYVKKEDPEDKFKGQSFTRTIIARALARITGESAAAIAQQRWGQTHPKFVQFMRAAVAGGGTGSGEWGAELAAVDGRFTGDFIEFLYGLTVFDRVPLRAIPSRVTVKGQDGAATGNWVGESKAIPMSKPDFSTVDLLPLKVAALTVLSNELIADSQPEAEALVRDSLAQASAQRIDQTFLSATAASAGVSPAGLLNGVTAIAASAATADGFRADMQSLLSIFVAAKMASGITLVMNPGTALALSMLVNSLGQEEFPGVTMNGGSFKGMNIVVGDNVTSGNIIAIRGQDVWKIGDSGIQVSMSDVATIEQDDAPAGASDTPVAMASSYVSMFQTESTAFKVVRRINFQKRRTGAVQYISDAEYGGVVS